MPTVTKTFTFSGTLQQATIPAGTTSIDIYLWGGAGGAGGADAAGAGGNGAAGHHVKKTAYSVTSNVGDTLEVAVGGGGAGGASGSNANGGNNGKGKTNTLDAIYHLAMGRSYFSAINAHTIQHQAEFMRIEGHFERNESMERIECLLKSGATKVFIRNGKKYKKLSDHIGLLPTVMISPSDVDLINEGSQTRRGFIDRLIGQADKAYLHQLIQYQKVLQHRNTLLKQMGRYGQAVNETLEIYNDQI